MSGIEREEEERGGREKTMRKRAEQGAQVRPRYLFLFGAAAHLPSPLLPPFIARASCPAVGKGDWAQSLLPGPQTRSPAEAVPPAPALFPPVRRGAEVHPEFPGGPLPIALCSPFLRGVRRFMAPG
ncbi:hypothetical protein NDU88_004029 [Pleurodeles waltl]|uniref:Uncharacterized protein n=1 Tax=Pleurodeles waltl TaxID=8319 RepID=A0AAV7PEJ0_PLEWA|nr:hypothetical protein NDU88_004029 [Pleurodeles waltl]